MSNPLFDTLFERHRDDPRIFLHLADGRTLTYVQFMRQVGQFANVLSDLGLTAGDRLVVQVDKSPEALAVYAACAQTGVIFLPLNTAYTASEVAYFVQDSGAKTMLCSPEDEAELSAVPSLVDIQFLTLDANGNGSFSDLADVASDWFATVERSQGDIAALLYTSGTTGRSKGAMLTQKNLLSNAKALTGLWEFTDQDVLLNALPIFHTHGLFVATNITLLTGGAMIFLPKFDLAQVLERLPDATSMMGVPTFYTRLLSTSQFDRDLVRKMRLFISGSAPLLAETHIRFEERTGHRILERYGMTETNMNTSNPYTGERRAGTVGMPLPGVELKITDENGADVKPGDIGQIEVRGDNVFKGYWQMPEKTREELREDGFFLTGDLGRVDSDGYVTIIGRNKDLIITGGYNVYPKEVEQAIDDLEGILESAVIGVPHPVYGESIIAVVVADAGHEVDAEAINAQLKSKIAKFKQPHKIIAVSELPRNTMGKVQKNVLREEYAAMFKD